MKTEYSNDQIAAAGALAETLGAAASRGIPPSVSVIGDMQSIAELRRGVVRVKIQVDVSLDDLCKFIGDELQRRENARRAHGN